MNARFLTRLYLLGGATAAIGVALAMCGDAAPGRASDVPLGEATATGERVPVAVARERSKLMHQVYIATLDMLHERYFHVNRSLLPARAMEDIFAQMAGEAEISSNWISVNTRAMSVSHEPKTDFEKKAAQELAAGKEVYEAVENGVYRRAGPVPLSSGCVSCHGGFGAAPTKTPRFAGLVIAMPVKED